MTQTAATGEQVLPDPPLRYGCPLPAGGLPAAAELLAGPSGLGTSAARIVPWFARAAGPDPGYAEVSWGDGTAPPLYCPVLGRVNDALAAEVDDRLVAWAADCGFEEDELTGIRGATFGRLAMLAHPDCDDPDRVLIAAQLNAAWWAADDLYADSTELGAEPTALPPRLVLAMSAMDPVPHSGEFSAPLEATLRSDRVLVALRSGIEHLTRHSTPAQVQRVCYATFSMFVSWDAYAAWRYTGVYPTAWEYLNARHHDNFYTSMTLVDVVGGYEVPANLYYDPRVRRAAFLAGAATVLVNDLYSVAKDAADEVPVCNMVLQIVSDRNCSVEEATAATVELHNQFVRDFQELHRSLRAVPSPELHRFLEGLRAWMAGGFEWHATNPRYRT